MSNYLFASDFETQVNAILAGQYDLQSAMRVRKDTPQILLALGMDNLPVLYSTRHMLQIFGLAGTHEFHPLDRLTVVEVPKALDHPLFITEEKNRVGTLDFGLSLMDPERVGSETLRKPLFLSMQMSGNGKYDKDYISCNFVKSFYGVESKERWAYKLINAVNENRLLYVDKEALDVFTKDWDPITRSKLSLSLDDIPSRTILQKSRTADYIHSAAYRDYVERRYGSMEKRVSVDRDAVFGIEGFVNGMDEKDVRDVLKANFRDRQNAARGSFLKHERGFYHTNGFASKNMDPGLLELIQRIEHTPCEIRPDGRIKYWTVSLEAGKDGFENRFTIQTPSDARKKIVITGKYNRSCSDQGLAALMGQAIRFKIRDLQKSPSKENELSFVQSLSASTAVILSKLDHRKSARTSGYRQKVRKERGNQDGREL